MNHFPATVILNQFVGPALCRLTLENCSPLDNALPGQFVMFRPDRWDADPLLGRPLSLMAAGNAVAEFLIQEVGRGTRDIARLRPGQTVSIIGPVGSAFNEPRTDTRNILVAGGVGLAPLLMWLEQFGHSASHPPKILYGARSAANLVLLERIRATGAELVTVTEDGSAGAKGLVTDALEPLLENGPVEVIACGPTAMMAATARMCRRASVNCTVSLENRMACGRGLCLGCALEMPDGEVYLVCREGPVMNATQVNWKDA